MKKLNVPDNIELSKTIRIIGKKIDKTTATVRDFIEYHLF